MTVPDVTLAEDPTGDSVTPPDLDPDVSSLPRRALGAGAAESASALTTSERLRDGQTALADRIAGWVVTLAITALAFVIRVVNLAYPAKLVFDETYYAKDAWSLLKFGYEKEWPKTANDAILVGNVDVFLDKASFIVHPPVGKWLIALGEAMFGMNSLGWRIMPAVFGSLLVLATIRLTRRLARSTLIGGIAGVLLMLDGLAFSMSRIALLDIFQAFFLVAAVACVVADRDWARWRLADRLDGLGVTDLGGEFGPVLWWRPWRLAAGVAFGLAIGTKWNSIYVLAVMGVLSVLWDVGARRLAGADWKSWLALLIDGVPAFIRMVVVAAVVYVGSWWGWLTTSGGYYRDWGAKNPDHPWTVYLGEMWASFLHYHQEIFNFHVGDYINDVTHPYASHPAGWLVLARPTGLDAVNGIKPGVDGCWATGEETCIRVMTTMGTPLLWWAAALAVVVAVIWWLGGRDWRFGVPLLAAAGTWVPWLATTGGRPLFFFYAITIIPFTVTALALVLGLILGPARGATRRRRGMIVGLVVALVAANFAYIYPMLTDELMLYNDWLARMWLRSWI